MSYGHIERRKHRDPNLLSAQKQIDRLFTIPRQRECNEPSELLFSILQVKPDQQDIDYI